MARTRFNGRLATLGAVALLGMSASACQFPFSQRRDGDSTPTPTAASTVSAAPSMTETPELDSLLLFGGGLLGAATYLRRSWRK